jgi:hypothetical protein
MRERPVGTVFQFGLEAADLPTLLRDLVANIETLGDDATVLDISIRPGEPSAQVYFVREG